MEPHLILVWSTMSMQLAQRSKKTVWEWGPETVLSVFSESCPDKPGKYKRANAFRVESVTRDCTKNQCRPSLTQAGNAMGVVGGSTVRFFWEGLWIETYSWEAKVTLFINTLRGSWLCGSHSDLRRPSLPWNSCDSAGAFFTWGRFWYGKNNLTKPDWKKYSFPPFFPFFFLPMEEWKHKEGGEGIVKSPYSPKDQGKERAVCPLLALFFSPSFLLLFSLASGDVKKCLLISSDRAWTMWRGWLVGRCQSMQGKNVPNKRVIS